MKIPVVVECRLGEKKKGKNKIIKYLTKHQAAAHTHTHTTHAIPSCLHRKRKEVLWKCRDVGNIWVTTLDWTTGGSSTAPGTDSLNSQQSGSEIKPFYFLMLVPEEQHGTFTTTRSKEKTTKGNTKHGPDNCTRFKGKRYGTFWACMG